MNMIQSAKDQIAELTKSAYAAAVEAGALPAGVETPVAVEIPKDAANGDYTTTFCLAAAKAMKNKSLKKLKKLFRPYTKKQKMAKTLLNWPPKILKTQVQLRTAVI